MNIGLSYCNKMIVFTLPPNPTHLNKYRALLGECRTHLGEYEALLSESGTLLNDNKTL